MMGRCVSDMAERILSSRHHRAQNAGCATWRYYSDDCNAHAGALGENGVSCAPLTLEHMSMNLSLVGVTLHVADVDRSLECYRKFPGAPVMFHMPGRFALLMI